MHILPINLKIFNNAKLYLCPNKVQNDRVGCTCIMKCCVEQLVIKNSTVT